MRLVAPGLAFIAATLIALDWRHGSVFGAAALLALGVALGNRFGLLVASVAVAWLNVFARPPAGPEAAHRVDLSRPVNVTVQPHSWERGPFGWRARGEILVMRQGRRVLPVRRSIELVLADGLSPPASHRVRARGFVRVLAGTRNGAPPAPERWRLRVEARAFLDSPMSREPSAWSRLPAILRSHVEAGVAAQEPSPGRDLAGALALGRRGALSKEVSRALAALGLSHLLAVSGLHLGVLAAAAVWFGRRLPRYARWLPFAGTLGAYCVLVGAQPSLARAALMAMLFCGALALSRPPRPLNALALAAAILVVWDPLWAVRLGFRMTVLATAGIIALANPLAARWSALPRWLAAPLAVSAAAQLAVLPVAAPEFGRLHPAAAIVNLLAVPWTALSLAAGFAWTAAATIAPGLAASLQPLLDAVAVPFSVLSDLPASRLLTWPVALSPVAAWLAAALLGAGLWWPRSGIALAGLALVWSLHDSSRRQGLEPELVMLDVGQGEALLLRHGAEAALIDGGGWWNSDIGGRVLVPALARLGVSSLRAVVPTHGDLDHCGGLLDLTAYLRVRESWLTPGERSSCPRALLARPGLRNRPVWRGRRLAVGEWRLLVLHPAASATERGNDASLVLLARVRGRSFLLTGDLGEVGERELLLGEGVLPEECCDVLKIGHHGSGGSTTLPFLARVAPRLALISAGAGNAYGHPSAAVRRRLSRRGIPALRTDRDGQIRIGVRADGSLRLTLPGSP